TFQGAYSALLLPAVMIAVSTDIVSFFSERLLSPPQSYFPPLFSLMLAFGYLQFWARRWTFGSLRYGETAFEILPQLEDLLASWLAASLTVIGAVQAVYLLRWTVNRFVLLGLLVLCGLFVKSYLEASSRRKIIGALTLGKARFRSTAETLTLF